MSQSTRTYWSRRGRKGKRKNKHTNAASIKTTSSLDSLTDKTKKLTLLSNNIEGTFTFNAQAFKAAIKDQLKKQSQSAKTKSKKQPANVQNTDESELKVQPPNAQNNNENELKVPPPNTQNNNENKLQLPQPNTQNTNKNELKVSPPNTQNNNENKLQLPQPNTQNNNENELKWSQSSQIGATDIELSQQQQIELVGFTKELVGAYFQKTKLNEFMTQLQKQTTQYENDEFVESEVDDQFTKLDKKIDRLHVESMAQLMYLIPELIGQVGLLSVVFEAENEKKFMRIKLLNNVIRSFIDDQADFWHYQIVDEIKKKLVDKDCYPTGSTLESADFNGEEFALRLKISNVSQKLKSIRNSRWKIGVVGAEKLHRNLKSFYYEFWKDQWPKNKYQRYPKRFQALRNVWQKNGIAYPSCLNKNEFDPETFTFDVEALYFEAFSTKPNTEDKLLQFPLQFFGRFIACAYTLLLSVYCFKNNKQSSHLSHCANTDEVADFPELISLFEGFVAHWPDYCEWYMRWNYKTFSWKEFVSVQQHSQSNKKLLYVLLQCIVCGSFFDGQQRYQNLEALISCYLPTTYYRMKHWVKHKFKIPKKLEWFEKVLFCNEYNLINEKLTCLAAFVVDWLFFSCNPWFDHCCGNIMYQGRYTWAFETSDHIEGFKLIFEKATYPDFWSIHSKSKKVGSQKINQLLRERILGINNDGFGLSEYGLGLYAKKINKHNDDNSFDEDNDDFGEEEEEESEEDDDDIVINGLSQPKRIVDGMNDNNYVQHQMEKVGGLKQINLDIWPQTIGDDKMQESKKLYEQLKLLSANGCDGETTMNCEDVLANTAVSSFLQGDSDISDDCQEQDEYDNNSIEINRPIFHNTGHNDMCIKLYNAGLIDNADNNNNSNDCNNNNNIIEMNSDNGIEMNFRTFSDTGNNNNNSIEMNSDNGNNNNNIIKMNSRSFSDNGNNNNNTNDDQSIETNDSDIEICSPKPIQSSNKSSKKSKCEIDDVSESEHELKINELPVKESSHFSLIKSTPKEPPIGDQPIQFKTSDISFKEIKCGNSGLVVTLHDGYNVKQATIRIESESVPLSKYPQNALFYNFPIIKMEGLPTGTWTSSFAIFENVKRRWPTQQLPAYEQDLRYLSNTFFKPTKKKKTLSPYDDAQTRMRLFLLQISALGLDHMIFAFQDLLSNHTFGELHWFGVTKLAQQQINQKESIEDDENAKRAFDENAKNPDVWKKQFRKALSNPKIVQKLLGLFTKQLVIKGIAGTLQTPKIGLMAFVVLYASLSIMKFSGNQSWIMKDKAKSKDVKDFIVLPECHDKYFYWCNKVEQIDVLANLMFSWKNGYLYQLCFQFANLSIKQQEKTKIPEFVLNMDIFVSLQQFISFFDDKKALQLGNQVIGVIDNLNRLTMWWIILYNLWPSLASKTWEWNLTTIHNLYYIVESTAERALWLSTTPHTNIQYRLNQWKINRLFRKSVGFQALAGVKHLFNDDEKRLFHVKSTVYKPTCSVALKVFGSKWIENHANYFAWGSGTDPRSCERRELYLRRYPPIVLADNTKHDVKTFVETICSTYTTFIGKPNNYESFGKYAQPPHDYRFFDKMGAKRLGSPAQIDSINARQNKLYKIEKEYLTKTKTGIADGIENNNNNNNNNSNDNKYNYNIDSYQPPKKKQKTSGRFADSRIGTLNWLDDVSDTEIDNFESQIDQEWNENDDQDVGQDVVQDVDVSQDNENDDEDIGFDFGDVEQCAKLPKSSYYHDEVYVP